MMMMVMVMMMMMMLLLLMMYADGFLPALRWLRRLAEASPPATRTRMWIEELYGYRREEGVGGDMEFIGSLPSSKELGLGGLTCLLRPVCLGICALPSILEACAWRTMKSGLTSV